ncbi:hypothetical protein [Labrenzia sp. CE80]|uniref:hypothetical protein n=1 Tax=Labrenzia sp. CE80 TaxID=1788986 RepID=UPI00129BD4D6|nr:hypothetical protein [Labrenzia sp. CE80]
MKKLIFAASALLASLGPGFASGAMASEDLDLSGYKPIPTSIYFDWQPEESTVFLRFDSGCLTAHTARLVTENLSADLDRDTGRLEINGSFLQRPPENPRAIGSADCMGSREKTIEIPHLTGGNYEVRWSGKLLWKLKLTDKPLETRLILEEVELGRPYTL